MVKQNSVKTNPWTAMLWGFLAFLLSGLLASVIIWRFDNYVLGTIITGAMGGLLLGLFTRQRGSLSKFAMGGGFGMPIALFLTFAFPFFLSHKFHIDKKALLDVRTYNNVFDYRYNE